MNHSPGKKPSRPAPNRVSNNTAIENLIVREESVADISAIRDVNEQAFGRRSEANVVDTLRHRGKITLSLVAEHERQVIGHILFSPVVIASNESVLSAIGLAPMAVLPRFQRNGVGSMLVREGIRRCQRAGHSLIVVIGHPGYYPRFGFSPARRYGIHSEYNVPENAFLVLELKEGALATVAGVAKYQPEFNEA